MTVVLPELPVICNRLPGQAGPDPPGRASHSPSRVSSTINSGAPVRVEWFTSKPAAPRNNALGTWAWPSRSVRTGGVEPWSRIATQGNEQIPRVQGSRIDADPGDIRSIDFLQGKRQCGAQFGPVPQRVLREFPSSRFRVTSSLTLISIRNVA